MTIQVHLKDIEVVEKLKKWFFYREWEGPLQITEYISLYRNNDFPVIINLSLDEWTMLIDHIHYVNNFEK